MTEFFSEDYSGEDWGEPSSFFLSETFWRSYLDDVDHKVFVFFSLYLKSLQDPNRIADVCESMGWQPPAAATWVDGIECGRLVKQSQMMPVQNEQVYTPHRHPVYILTKALIYYVVRMWEILLEKETIKPNYYESVVFVKNIKQSESEALMGAHALELADLQLAICHYKRAVSYLNLSLAYVASLEVKDVLPVKGFKKNAQRALLDLREVWLHVMDGCRKG